MKPVRLDCARHVRERAQGNFLEGRVFEIVDEVRVVKGLGFAAEAARAESANCNAGDGTAELREVLAGETTLPEPRLLGGAVRFDGLSVVVDWDLDLS